MSKLASRLEEWRAKQAEIAQGKIEAPKKFKTAKRAVKPRIGQGAKSTSATSVARSDSAELKQLTQPGPATSLAGAAAAAAAAASSASAPVAQQLKQALDALRLKREPMTPQQLEAVCGFPAGPDAPLAAALAASDRVELSSAGDYTYKARHELHTSQELLHFLASRPEGTHIAEVRDAYEGLEADVTKLASRGKILAWRSTETDELVLYPKHVPGMPSMSVDAEIVSEWLAIKLPAAAGGLEEALRKAGLCAIPRRAKRKPPPADAKEKKRKQNRAMRVATNVHMPELFAGPMATRIE